MESSTSIELPVVYHNLPGNKLLVNKPDSVLHVRLRTQGFRLFSDKYFGSYDPFPVYLRNLKLKQENGQYSAFILTDHLHSAISRKLKTDAQILSISPDTIFFHMISIHHKKVPVIPDLKYTLKKQYFLYDSISIYPDSIIVSGPPYELESIKYLQTKKIELNEISEDQNILAEIDEPFDKQLSFSPVEVNIVLDVEEFTEAEVEIPIKVIKEADTRLRIFPDKVKITYLVALKDYKKIDKEMFSAIVRYVPSAENRLSKLKVIITQKPDLVKITKIKPEKVEFILHK